MKTISLVTNRLLSGGAEWGLVDIFVDHIAAVHELPYSSNEMSVVVLSGGGKMPVEGSPGSVLTLIKAAKDEND